MTTEEPAPPKEMSRRATLMVSAAAMLIVLMPFLFWQSTWFGRELSDEQISEHLADKENPRNTQHALAQISERTTRGDESVKQWYPQIIALADHPVVEIRLTAAWLMGQDVEQGAFLESLKKLLEDPESIVRRNAALSLVRFGDASGRAELIAMLGSFTVVSPHQGTLTNRLAEGDSVARGTLLARVAVQGQEEPAELRSPVPGTVTKRLLADETEVSVGDEVTLLGPGSEHVFEALRALYLVGTEDDIDQVRHFLRPRDDMPSQVAGQARLTIERIRERADQ